MSKVIRNNINRDQLIKVLIPITLLCSFSIRIMANPEVVQPDKIQNCQYINNVEGDSGYGKKYEWQTLAKNSALLQAEKLGASHVVWERFNPIGAFNGIAIGKAYQCNS